MNSKTSNKSITICSIDLATVSGYAIYKDKRIIISGVIDSRGKGHSDITTRYNTLIKQVRQLIKKYGITHFIIERPYKKESKDDYEKKRNESIYCGLVGYHSVLKHELVNHCCIPVSNIDYYEPNEWRSKVGMFTRFKRRNELKDEALKFVTIKYGFDSTNSNDEAEAILMLIAYCKANNLEITLN